MTFLLFTPRACLPTNMKKLNNYRVFLYIRKFSHWTIESCASFKLIYITKKIEKWRKPVLCILQYTIHYIIRKFVQFRKLLADLCTSYNKINIELNIGHVIILMYVIFQRKLKNKKLSMFFFITKHIGTCVINYAYFKYYDNFALNALIIVIKK